MQDTISKAVPQKTRQWLLENTVLCSVWLSGRSSVNHMDARLQVSGLSKRILDVHLQMAGAVTADPSNAPIMLYCCVEASSLSSGTPPPPSTFRGTPPQPPSSRSPYIFSDTPPRRPLLWHPLPPQTLSPAGLVQETTLQLKVYEQDKNYSGM